MPSISSVRAFTLARKRLDFLGVDGIGRHILNLVRNVQLVQKAHDGGRPGTAGFSVEGYFHINRRFQLRKFRCSWRISECISFSPTPEIRYEWQGSL